LIAIAGELLEQDCKLSGKAYRVKAAYQFTDGPRATRRAALMTGVLPAPKMPPWAASKQRPVAQERSR
jgi:hypothetical protein